ncbi:MAG: FG-GAP-like repeat-containing protein, partial [Planctomycetota bacterium]|nr:FG-GAP-like repeat-containing protein [Planctomycetota bacterium]
NIGASTVWINDGAGTFTDSGQAFGKSSSYSVALGDLDGDGDLDAVVANFGAPNTVWTNDGTGTFTDSEQVLGNGQSYSVALGDLDGDGDLDAKVANSSEANAVWTNDAWNISAVYNRNSGSWFESATQAVASASAGDTLLLGGTSFDVAGIIDARGRPLTFSAREPVEFGADLLFMASDGSVFLDWSGNGAGYSILGRFIAPDGGSLVFRDLDVITDGELLQNDAFLIGYSDITNSAGTCYLKGELSADSIQTVDGGVNYVAADTNVFGDYLNTGSTIIQRGTLYIYGDLTNTGTMTGEFNNGFMRGTGPEEGDGYSIGGAYTIGAEASLVLPEPIWNLAVGGNLDIAIDDPARFAMAQATIELNGLAPGTQQTLETLSADLGASGSGFASSNFPIGTLRVASGSNTVLVNEHVNSTDTPCEVLYVDRLVVEPGASLTTGGCRIYTHEAILNGTIENADDIIVI